MHAPRPGSDCDLDLDGVVTMEELGRVAPAQVLDDRFQLGGAPVSPLLTMVSQTSRDLRRHPGL